MTRTALCLGELLLAAGNRADVDADAYTFVEDALAPGVSLHVVVDGDDTLWLNGLDSTHRQRGHASRVLRLVTWLADKHGVVLRGNPLPYPGGGGPDRDWLVAWYGRHGFALEQEADEEQGLADIIRREPRAAVLG